MKDLAKNLRYAKEEAESLALYIERLRDELPKDQPDVGDIAQLRRDLNAAILCATPERAREKAMAAMLRFINDNEVAHLIGRLPTRCDPLPSPCWYRRKVAHA